jgi:hypothetical protein
MSSILTGPRTGDARRGGGGGGDDDDVIRSTLESVMVTGGGVAWRRMVRLPPKGEAVVDGSGSTRLADGFSRSMLCRSTWGRFY